MIAEQGNATAQYNLGVLYGQGKGVVQDSAEAARWYRLAAEQGNAMAQGNLGIMYKDGEGVLQHYVLSHMWFNIAAANGNKNAIRMRDHIAKFITSTELNEAQERARVCMSTGYQECD